MSLVTNGMVIRNNADFEALGDDSLKLPRSLAFSIAGNCVVGTRDSGAYILSTDQKHWSRTSLKKGSVNAMTTLANGTMIAVVQNVGAYQSLDNGITWSFLDSALTKHVVRIVSEDDKTLLACCADSGLIRSTDNGRNWARLGRTQLDTSLSDITIRNHKIYVSSNTFGDGVSVSSDEGLTWRTFSEGLQTGFASMQVTDDHLIFVGWDRGCMRSSDDGRSWQRQQFMASAGDQPSFKIAIDSAGDYFGYSTVQVARSTDKGLTWVNVSDSNLRKIGSIGDIAITPDGALMAVSTDALSSPALSTDKGAHWSFIPMNEKGRYIRPGKLAAISDSVFCLAAGGEIGLLLTTDRGKHWEIDTLGLGLQSPRWLHKLRSGAVIAATSKGIYRSSDSGSSWKQLNQLQLFKVIGVGSTLFGVNDSALYRSTDDGVTWIMSISGSFASGYTNILPDLSVYAFDGYSTISTTGPNLTVRSFVASEAAKIYPNPAYDLIHIVAKADADFQAELIDELGRAIPLKSHSTVDNVHSFQIGFLSPGVYSVRYHDGAQTFDRRFIKLAR
jgi:photosystem II stability/assembly factor-like uncharacterized protein